MASDPPATPVENGSADNDGDERYVAMSEDPRFVGLRRVFRGFVFPMTVAFLVWYLAYVLLSAYARDFMATPVAGNLNIAFVFGILQFVSTFLIAWWYSSFAARKLDPTADEIRAELETQEDAR